MFRLTDDAIENAIVNISGFVVAAVADELKMSVEQVSEKFFASHTYSLVSDKNTGYYWDSIFEIIDLFKEELM